MIMNNDNSNGFGGFMDNQDGYGFESNFNGLSGIGQAPVGQEGSYDSNTYYTSETVNGDNTFSQLQSAGENVSNSLNTFVNQLFGTISEKANNLGNSINRNNYMSDSIEARIARKEAEIAQKEAEIAQLRAELISLKEEVVIDNNNNSNAQELLTYNNNANMQEVENTVITTSGVNLRKE